MALRKTTYELLCKELGTLDKRRREILNDLKKSPEFIIKHVNDLLKEFVTKGHWFSRKNEKNEFAYFRATGYVLNDKKLEQTDRGSVLIAGTITWEVYDYNSTKKEMVEPIRISAFNDIEPQILNGRAHAPKFSEKSIIKNILAAKKKDLEEQLKKLKLEMAAI
jgi:hypothetical protein